MNLVDYYAKYFSIRFTLGACPQQHLSDFQNLKLLNYRQNLQGLIFNYFLMCFDYAEFYNFHHFITKFLTFFIHFEIFYYSINHF